LKPVTESAARSASSTTRRHMLAMTVSEPSSSSRYSIGRNPSMATTCVSTSGSVVPMLHSLSARKPCVEGIGR